MNFKLDFLPEAVKDLKSLAGYQQILVLKAIKKVQSNPLPTYEGGFGKPLGNKGSNDLTGSVVFDRIRMAKRVRYGK